MDPPVRGFWAKLLPYRGSDVRAWHPLNAHAADVAACTEKLLQTSIVRDRIAHLGGLRTLTPSQIDRLAVLAALHDLGKFNIGFQNKRLADPPFMAGHVKEALAAFGNPPGRKIGEALKWTTMADWGADKYTFEDLFVTALGHHGRPVPPSGRPTPGAWQPTPDLDPFEGIRELREDIEQWYPRAFEEGGDSLPDAQPFQHAFNGLLTLADWIGSNETFFPFAEKDDPSRIEFARERAGEALRHLGLDARRAREGLGAHPPQFDQIWPFEPRPAQQLFDEMPADESASLAILEAPTGSGKTEAALIRFLRLFSAGEVDGLYFALPTRAAATQMHGRVKSTIEKVMPDPEVRPPVVHAVPGYLGEDSEDALLDHPESLWSDGDRRWRYWSWASERPKRYLSGTVAVGTIDQALLSALAVDHSHLRATSLLRHLLVVDEVHASDAYMSRLLEEVLERHLDAGGHGMLMSATLGERARRRFIDLAQREDRPQKSLDNARSFPYPIVVHTGPDTPIREMPVEPIDLSERQVAIELMPVMEHPGRVAREALTAGQQGARVLAIRNTVGGCRQLQRSLEQLGEGPDDGRLFRCEGIVAPHHSRFARTDRELLDRAVERQYGKDTPPTGTLLAATQTVEQSLDIDADLLITDLCPADVLLQRIGRLHRHERDTRPSGFEEPRVIVLVPSDRNLGKHIATRGRNSGRAWGPHGIGTVYEDLRVLEATWRELRQRSRLCLPSDSRPLVEAATHPDALNEVTVEGDGAWTDHAQTMNGVRRAEAGIARLNLADWSSRFGDPDSLFPDDPGERIKTRLGEGDRRARFPKPIAGPFGAIVEEVTVPAWMAEEAETDAEVEGLASSSGVIEFRFGGHGFRYDRWGLRRQNENHGQDDRE